MREARLKAEHADIYPGLDAAVWYPAAYVAEYLLARLAALPPGTEDPASRVLDENHFEFRGGPGAAGHDRQRHSMG